MEASKQEATRGNECGVIRSRRKTESERVNESSNHREKSPSAISRGIEQNGSRGISLD